MTQQSFFFFFFADICICVRLLQFVQEALSKNDTVLQFDSPTVNCCADSQSPRTFIQLDEETEELKSFDYHPDPTFNTLTKNMITETSIIIVNVRTGGPFAARRSSSVDFTLALISLQGRGFAKAMTAKEAQAFVGDALCNVNILQVKY